jgi:ATP-dependent RNA helicase DeaD
MTAPPALDSAAAPVSAPPTFDRLPLTVETRRAIDEMGFVTPTPVQIESFGPAVDGRDLIVQARTGTGKTAAFGLPLVDRLVVAEPRVQALILAPTRELALQSAREIERIGKHKSLRTAAVYGGAPMERQVHELASGAQIVSGTPGRVLDHLTRGTLDARGLKVLVLDEADEMLSMGFARELNAILEKLPKERQTWFFSATIENDVQRMADRHLRDPHLVALSSDAVGAATISHFMYPVSGLDRTGDLRRIIEIEDPESAIVFCNTKMETERVAQELQQAGFDADWLNGDLPQSEREQVMRRTREGKLRFLVATDVAARGIDISHLTHVINYSLPLASEQYVHRTGRTGRAGRTGTALSLVGPKEIGALYYLRLQYKIFPVERSLPSAGEQRTRLEADRLAMVADVFPGEPGEVDRALARRILTHANAERLLAGLLASFFGARGEDVDDQAAAARRAKAPAPVPAARDEAPRRMRADRPERGERLERGERSERSERGERRVREPRAERPMVDVAPVPERAPRTERAATNDHDGERPARRRREPAAPRSGDTTTAVLAPGTDPAFAEDEPTTRTPAPPVARDVTETDAASPAASSSSHAPTEEEEGMATLYLGVGRRDNVRPGEIARFLREQAALEREEIGRIRIRDKHTFVGVPTEKIAAVAAALNGQTFFDRALLAEPARAPRT